MVNGGFQPPLLLRLTRINRASNRCFWKIEGGYGIPGLLYGCPMHDVVWLGSEAALHIILHWGTIKAWFSSITLY